MKVTGWHFTSLTKEDGVTHWPHVRDKAGFVRRLMEEFVGGRMSLEGDLSRCAFPDDIVLGRGEEGALRRNTLTPRLDFIVLRLEPDTIPLIVKEMMAAGLRRAIIHVQIDHGGVLQLGAYDNFYPGCVVTGPGVSPALLTELHSAGILRDYKPAMPSNRR
jgi:hypothetical protein